MGNMFADVIGFAATLLGGFAFRDELANASNFALGRLGTVWRKARLFYLHSVAAGAWWMLTTVIILLAAAHVGAYRLASSFAIGNDGTWLDVQLGVAFVTFLPLLFSWVRLLPAKRIKTWSWINGETDKLKALGENIAKRRSEDAPDDEIEDLEAELTKETEEFRKEFRRRYGRPRGPMFAVLVTIFAPIVTGIGFAISAAMLATRSGVEMYQTMQVALLGFACYVLGEIMLRTLSGVLESVLGDGGDALNRIANAVLVRPGLLVLPFITEENYEKIMPKPVEVPFKKAAEAVKGSTFSMRTICLVFIGWTIILPSVSILGVVVLAGVGSYVIVMFHEYRKLDPKPFLDGSSRVHAWFLMAVLFFRIVQLVILGLWAQWWSGSTIWNPIASWVNNLLDDGGWNWVTFCLIIFGAPLAYFFAEKMKDMKHPVMLNAFRALTAFFGLLALLPLIGWGLELGGVAHIRLPLMPSNAELALADSEPAVGEAETPPAAVEEAPHAPDSIDRLTGHATAETPTADPAPVAAPTEVATTTVVATRDTPRSRPSRTVSASRSTHPECEDLEPGFLARVQARGRCL